MYTVLKFNKSTMSFSVKSTAILNPNNWKSSFKRFIESEMNSNIYYEFSTEMMAKKSLTKIPKIKFYDACSWQIYHLYMLLHDEDYLRIYGSRLKRESELIKNQVKEIYYQTIAKLHQLEYSTAPDGSEQLKYIKDDDDNPCYSIESYGDHRIIYNHELPNTVRIFSILFHYERDPEGFANTMIFQGYINLIKNAAISNKAIQKVIIEFMKDCKSHPIHQKVLDNLPNRI